MKVPVKIPEYTNILIEAGERVDFSTPLLKKKGKKSIQIPVAHMLGFHPDKIFLRLKKSIGDYINKGELLVENKNLFSTKRYFSEVEGILREINHASGALIIEQDSREEDTQNCYFTGEVEAIYDDYLELKVDKVYKVQIKDSIPYFGAAVFYTKNQNNSFSEDEVNGKCIYAVEIPSMEHSKIEALGGQGLIVKNPIDTASSLQQIVLAEDKDFDHIGEHKYAYCIIGPEPQSLYFYE